MPRLQVAVACLWAGAANRLLLPWSSGDWCRERLAGAYEAAGQLLVDSAELQLQAYRHLAQTAAAVAEGTAPAGSAPVQQQRWQQQQPASHVVLHIDTQQQQPAAVQRQPAGVGADSQRQQDRIAAPATQQEVQQRLQQLRTSLQSSVVAPLVAVQKAVDAEVSVWHHHAPRGMAARSVKLLLRGMLDLADRITALQATLAALPDTSLSHASATRSAGSGSLTAAAAVAVAGIQQSSRPVQQQAAHAMDAELAGTDVHAVLCDQRAVLNRGVGAAAEGAGAAALRYLAAALMGPLHESVAAQMVLLQAAAAAVKELLLLPHGRRTQTQAAAVELEHHPEQRLQQALHELQQQRHSSRELLVQLRQAIHQDMRQQQKQRAETGAAAVDGWWVHASAHYMQQLAFTYALDKAVLQMAAVAQAALQEGDENR
jgi:hypothetical protein